MIQRSNRIESLDYLMGIMVFMIMCYHYTIFSEFSSCNYILNKFGISKIMAYFFVSLPVTLIVSYLVYKFFEKPMMKFGKKVSIHLTRTLK